MLCNHMFLLAVNGILPQEEQEEEEEEEEEIKNQVKQNEAGTEQSR